MASWARTISTARVSPSHAVAGGVDNVAAAVECARAVQRAFEAFNLASQEKLRVRIGLDAGEPVEDSNDLFGATVQMAARICQDADPDTILVSPAVRDLLSDRVKLAALGPRRLKGFSEPVALYEVAWR